MASLPTTLLLVSLLTSACKGVGPTSEEVDVKSENRFFANKYKLSGTKFQKGGQSRLLTSLTNVYRENPRIESAIKKVQMN